MRELVTQAMQAVEPQPQRTDLTVEVHDLLDAEADSVLLKQVWVNLIANAVKFTEQGSVVCAAHRADGFLVTSVIDSGVGIAPKDYDKVFEEFVQVGDVMTDRPQGTGLGLPICQRIVHAHGGRIEVKDRAGAGAEADIHLPLDVG